MLWTPEAEQNRNDIWDHIAAENPSAAARMDLLFSEAAAKLAEFAMLGRTGKILGTRELIPHASYRLVYEMAIDENTVWVLVLIHTARRWATRAGLRGGRMSTSRCRLALFT